ELIPDTSACPGAREMPVTSRLPVGAHLSVTLRLADGSLYGTFCCMSHHPNPSLNERDLSILRAFAELAAQQINRALANRKINQEIEYRIQSILTGNLLSIVYQPIYHIGEKRISGFESLSRFSAT